MPSKGVGEIEKALTPWPLLDPAPSQSQKRNPEAPISMPLLWCLARTLPRFLTDDRTILISAHTWKKVLCVWSGSDELKHSVSCNTQITLCLRVSAPTVLITGLFLHKQKPFWYCSQGPCHYSTWLCFSQYEWINFSLMIARMLNRFKTARSIFLMQLIMCPSSQGK